MTRAEYDAVISDWVRDVRDEALRLWESGVDEIDCTGLAINVVESRRRKTAKALQRLNPRVPSSH
jgi:hypothetical protein